MFLHTRRHILDFILREWLFFSSATGLLVTSLYLYHFPTFSTDEFEVIFILAALFITVKGLEHSGLILHLSQSIEKGKYIPVKLVIATFILSALVTNDIALIVIVPLTLSLNINRKDIIVILEALAANAGSALSPFGNPQNLFIYWVYDIKPWLFVKSIAPFSFVFFCLLIIVSYMIKTSLHKRSSRETIPVNSNAIIYSIFLLVIILTVLRILPVLTGMIAVVYAIVFDRKSLVVDYLLLLTFICFFGLAENMKVLFSSEIAHPKHIFMFSALASQVISNVPAGLVLAKFTTQWKALLWGVNVGGFGSLIGSLANLIAYRLYITHKTSTTIAVFTFTFIAIGYLAFIIGIGLYFLLN